MSKESKEAKPDKVIRGSSIVSFNAVMGWSVGGYVDHYTVTLRDGTVCKITDDEICKALKQSSFNGFMKRKYHHLQTRDKKKA